MAAHFVLCTDSPTLGVFCCVLSVSFVCILRAVARTQVDLEWKDGAVDDQGWEYLSLQQIWVDPLQYKAEEGLLASLGGNAYNATGRTAKASSPTAPCS